MQTARFLISIAALSFALASSASGQDVSPARTVSDEANGVSQQVPARPSTDGAAVQTSSEVPAAEGANAASARQEVGSSSAAEVNTTVQDAAKRGAATAIQAEAAASNQESKETAAPLVTSTDAGAEVAAPAQSVAPGTEQASMAPAPVVVVEPIGPEVVQRAVAMADKSVHPDDLAGLKAYYAAFPGKPLWIQERGLSARARALMAEIGRADSWGLRARDYRLPAGDVGPDRETLSAAEARLTLAALAYARHAKGGRYDPKRLSIAIDRDPPVNRPETLLAELASADAPDRYLRGLHPQHEQFQRLRKLYVALKAGQGPVSAAAKEERAEEETANKSNKRKRKKAVAKPETVSAERVLMNMEQWRWMPETLGSLHIAANIPEFMVRVVKNGQVIHSERMIAGEVDKQTPIFSQDMQSVVFHPGWGVPNSIKVKELLPGLLRGRDTLSRSGLKATYKGRPVDPTTIDWRTTDIRNLTVIQPPGRSNVLGVVKFQFPNKNDIYMHDTPTKHLFNSKVRAFSHGCMRIRNPVKLAEVVFAETAGWSPARVASLIKNGPMDNRIPLQRKIPVHVTSFTVTVDQDGKPHAFSDIYGHEKRIGLALDGKFHLIQKKVVNLSAARAEVLSRAGGGQSFRRRDDDWMRNVFPGFN